MFNLLTTQERRIETKTNPLRQSAWASARVSKRLDSELASQLRMFLRADFEQANCWSMLRRVLRSKGFSLKLDQGRLRLVDSHSRVAICSTGFLGFPLAALERQFGASVQSNLWNNWLIG
ncbi:hypothetical protein [Epibacterium ulvae]|uniref:Uncharacterized protein n=1 Tax=Epibacterium ulvae TaxID=1156985 RepID=A0A1G5QXT0_9RHOB|nr:hypothetical protein [Epibacterium ulvae]SCZ66061.1 hypothetical protein SAMN04488118_106136 [Epibacterium ulvae]